MNHSWLETFSFCHFQQILFRHQNVPSLCGHPKTVLHRLVTLRKDTLNLFDALDYLLMCWITMSLCSCLYRASKNMFVFAKKLFCSYSLKLCVWRYMVLYVIFWLGTVWGVICAVPLWNFECAGVYMFLFMSFWYETELTIWTCNFQFVQSCCKT